MAKKQVPMKKMEVKQASSKSKLPVKSMKLESDTVAPTPKKIVKARSKASGMTTAGALIRSAGIAGTMIGLGKRIK